MQSRKPKQTKHPQAIRWTCSHRNYGLNCVQFDELWNWAGGRCQMCRLDEQRAGVLCIDHDAAVHPHAVRGLLCTECNLWLGDGRTLPQRFELHPPAGNYLLRPWYRRPGAPNLRPHAPMLGRRFNRPDAKVHYVGGWHLTISRNAVCGAEAWYLIPDSELNQSLNPCLRCFRRGDRIESILKIARGRHARLQAALAYEWPAEVSR